jgi:hypothetical protein
VQKRKAAGAVGGPLEGGVTHPTLDIICWTIREGAIFPTLDTILWATRGGVCDSRSIGHTIVGHFRKV